jgi:exopolyphosphatase/pppGpp-phosphohydrolase
MEGTHGYMSTKALHRHLLSLKDGCGRYIHDTDDPREQQEILRWREYYRMEIQRVEDELRRRGKIENRKWSKIAAAVVALHVVIVGASSIARGMEGFGVSIGILAMVWFVGDVMYALLS